ncbi:aspartate aminotransferase family protein [Alphaproteobacteria bacterium GH1-50]|uniref:Aspartate aminotransferase family protein n=1 Tax=Kangsaoukella pontilimi TaxID=2691042 RepID=A0A7C9ITG1_9RHOB|nr:aspartate aminotransferase family protein [Kangsaoukella pontilimi]MXQ09686.1 aspartate aminotransferase family protein [Kangsaoukella pontilimi]
MSDHVFGRSTKGTMPTAVKGEGCYIIDKTGKRYFDGSGGAAVSCLGHSDQSVKDAIRAQLDDLAFAHTGFFTSDAAEELADMLVARAPEGINRVYQLSGGSEAVEAALKLARQYYLEIGQPERRHIIARRQSYHGNTLGALAAGGNAWRREQYRPLLIETHHVTPCYEYRERRDDESAEDFGTRLAQELEAEVQRLGPDNVMAFVAEPVVGATSGAVPPVPGYFRQIREICDRYGILLILDEVMCGMGRTGSFFACEQDGISPDIVTIAKGLGAGYASIGAMLCTETIYQAIANGSGMFQHGHTYHGHPLAAAAGRAVIRAMDERKLVEGVAQKGPVLEQMLRDRFGQNAHVGDIRGRGFFRGIEFVADRETKATFDPSLNLSGKLKNAAMDAGLVIYPGKGTIDGKHGDHVLIAPPFIASEDDLAEMVDRLGQAVDKSLAAVA